MKTIYFPFTTIEAGLAAAVTAAWGPVSLLQPSRDTVLPETRRLQEAGHAALLFPAAAAHEPLLQDLLERCERWADQHAGSDRGALIGQGRTIPFFDDQSAAHLVTEIRRGSRVPEAPSAPDPDSALMADRVFLAMAQKFDCQQAELAREIDALAVKEQQMLALLKGEEEMAGVLPASPWAAPPPVSAAMTDLRLKVWARVMAAAVLPSETEILFLTASPDAFAQIQERFPQMQVHLRGSAPMAASASETPPNLPPWLSRAVPGPSTRSVSAAPLPDQDIDLIEIPAVPPGTFIERLAGRPPSASSSKAVPASSWVGCLTPRGVRP